jgi:hypothetical protein
MPVFTSAVLIFISTFVIGNAPAAQLAAWRRSFAKKLVVVMVWL